MYINTNKSHEALVTWRPEVGGKFRGSLAFKMDGRFPAQVSVVGEAVDIGGGGGGNRRKGDAREGRKRAKGAPAGARSRGRSLSQEAASRGAVPYTSVRLSKVSWLSLVVAMHLVTVCRSICVYTCTLCFSLSLYCV